MLYVSTLPTGGRIEMELFKRTDAPDVLYADQLLGRDTIYVADTEGNFTQTLSQYLKTIENKAQRKLEEVKIKTLVGWYDED